MLVGYDGHQVVLQAGISDAGVSSEAGTLLNTPAPEAAVPAPPEPLDGSATAGGPADDAAAASARSADAQRGLLDPVLLADANVPVPLPGADASALGTSDAGLPACTGAPALGLCWHLGAFGASCDVACDTNYGGFDQRTIFYTGEPREGGSLANCRTVLLALGITAAPSASYRPDGLGLGCHLWNTGATYWIDDRQSGPFASGDSYFAARRVCACAY